MAVTHTTRGFVGQVDEVYEAKRFGVAGAPFRVGGVNSWALSAAIGVDRTVNIAVGEGAVCGGAVYDSTTAADTVTCAANTGTQNRYDAVVLRIDWATHTAGFVVIAGTSSPPLVNVTTTIDNTKINRVPGVRYDAILGVIRVRPSVGPFTSGDITDCRMWGGFEGYANIPSELSLNMLDTFPGSLVHSVASDVVWNRLAGGFWGFEKWIGTDKTKQPMMSGRSLARSIPYGAGTAGALIDVIDHSAGMLTAVGSPVTAIQCNNYGRVRVEAHAFSDAPSGTSLLTLATPFGGGHYLSSLSDERKRDGVGGYGGSGVLNQTITTGPVEVAPGDVFGLTVYQLNLGGTALNYDLYLTVTYV